MFSKYVLSECLLASSPFSRSKWLPCFEVPGMKELGQRRTGWSLAFLPPEEQVTSNRKKHNCALHSPGW